uniref:CBS domain-containing protein n=1 Tax=Spongospora subterranea TaxID=70186 RepID=A0A0H5RSQ6_9EUKA|eukprot:CRZ11774.1 hypothetical protein [Spongospora subterranea]
MTVIGDVMTGGPAVLCLLEKDSIRTMIEQMLYYQCSSVAITDTDDVQTRKPLAILTKTDVLRWVLKHDLSSPIKSALDPTRALTIVDTDMDVDVAANLMVHKKVHHLIVIEREASVLKGIISAFSLATYMASEKKVWPFPKNFVLDNICEYQNVELEAVETNV